MYYCNRKSFSLTLFVLLLILLGGKGFSQNGPSSYYKNFVRHANGQLCQHLAPEATFSAFLNQDQSKVLIENAPRWDGNNEPNIGGNGIFGVELGNFSNPPLTAGDSVFVRFTCNATNQQAVLGDSVTSIPWLVFPEFLDLVSVPLPHPPQNVTLQTDTITFQRTVSWTPVGGINYSVYRRAYSDTLPDGRPRMLYNRIAENLSGGSFTDVTALSGEKYGYFVYAISAEGVISSHSEEVNEDPYIPPGSDLTIKYVARLPRIDYVWGSTNPQEEGWPLPGETVTWQAVINNYLDSTITGVPYRWYLDGALTASGTVDIPAGDTAAVDFPWSWTFTRHELKFVVDPDNIIPEEEEGNNELLVYTNAISAGLYVEQSVYDYFHQHQWKLAVGSNSWEDWAHRQVGIWNEMFADAIYPLSPAGVLDRIRLDKITVVSDGALPLAGGLPTNNPNLNDRTVDLQWGFPATLLNGSFYANHTAVSLGNPFYYEGSLIHELGHARYLIDVYGFNIHTSVGDTTVVAIMENGEYIVATPYMPLVGGAVHISPFHGLMQSNYTFVDEYSTVALNLIAGHRATVGNYNAPQNIGVFLQDLPDSNQVTLKDANGNILPFANVKLYQAEGQPGVWYGKHYDNIPDLELTADANGQVGLGRCPFDNDGTIDHTFGISNGVIILRVEHNGWVGYAFLEATFFNMQYWAGNTALGGYEVEVTLIPPTAIAGEENGTVPGKYALYQNYPNPFNPVTNIGFRLPVGHAGISDFGLVNLDVYDLLGRKIATLVNEKLTPGDYKIQWDGRDDTGKPVVSGVYLYRLQVNEFVQTRKMVLLR
jgi:hypothetical protein